MPYIETHNLIQKFIKQFQDGKGAEHDIEDKIKDIFEVGCAFIEYVSIPDEMYHGKIVRLTKECKEYLSSTYPPPMLEEVEHE